MSVRLITERVLPDSMVDIEQTMERLRGDSQFQITVGLTVFFLAIFPAYFAYAASVADAGSLIQNDSGEWIVSFSEDTITIEESVMLGNGEEHDTFFEIKESDLGETMIGYVEISISCSDNDDPGPGFTDSGEVASDLSGIETGSFAEQDEDGPCNGDAFVLRWDVTENYTGEAYNTSGSQDQISSNWNDQGWGLGTWAATVTADINSPGPVVGQIIDSDEEYDIVWTLVTYDLIIEDSMSEEF